MMNKIWNMIYKIELSEKNPVNPVNNLVNPVLSSS